jgi:hypothetical protein
VSRGGLDSVADGEVDSLSAKRWIHHDPLAVAIFFFLETFRRLDIGALRILLLSCPMYLFLKADVGQHAAQDRSPICVGDSGWQQDSSIPPPRKCRKRSLTLWQSCIQGKTEAFTRELHLLSERYLEGVGLLGVTTVRRCVACVSRMESPPDWVRRPAESRNPPKPSPVRSITPFPSQHNSVKTRQSPRTW